MQYTICWHIDILIVCVFDCELILCIVYHGIKINHHPWEDKMYILLGYCE